MARTKSFTHSTGDTGEHPTVSAIHEPRPKDLTILNGSAPAFVVSTALRDARDLAKTGRTLGAEEPGLAMNHYDDAVAVLDAALVSATRILDPSEKKRAVVEIKSEKTVILAHQVELYKEVGFEDEARAKETEAETERRDVRSILIYGLARS